MIRGWGSKAPVATCQCCVALTLHTSPRVMSGVMRPNGSALQLSSKAPSGHVMRQHSVALVRLQSLHRDESAADGVRTLS